MNLAEHTLSHYSKTRLDIDVSGLSSNLEMFRDLITQTIKEISVFDTYELDETSFTDAVTHLQQNINEYVVTFGEAATVGGTTYIQDLKNLISSNTYFQDDPELMDSLEITSVDELNDMITLPISYVYFISESILSGCLQKLISEYNSSEFVVGINIAIFSFLYKLYKISTLLSNINDSKEYLNDNYNYTKQFVNKKIVEVNNLLYTYYITGDGEIDEERLLSSLTSPQKTKCQTIKRLVLWMINTIWNEVKIKTRSKELSFSNIYALSNNTSNVIISDPDLKTSTQYMDVYFNVT